MGQIILFHLTNLQIMHLKLQVCTYWYVKMKTYHSHQNYSIYRNDARLPEFSPFHTMFSKAFFTRVVQCQERVNPFPNKPWFLRVCSTGLLKTLREKEKLLITSNFSFSHSVFNLFGELSAISIKFKIVVCKVFEIGRG